MELYKYTHQKLGEEIEAISGHYSLEKEEQFTYKGRQVCYCTGYSVVDTSCCGPGGCGFAFVAGYIVNWKNNRDSNGADTSDIEPIISSEEKQELKALLTKSAHVLQVNFWTPQTARVKP